MTKRKAIETIEELIEEVKAQVGKGDLDGNIRSVDRVKALSMALEILAAADVPFETEHENFCYFCKHAAIAEIECKLTNSIRGLGSFCKRYKERTAPMKCEEDE